MIVVSVGSVVALLVEEAREARLGGGVLGGEDTRDLVRTLLWYPHVHREVAGGHPAVPLGGGVLADLADDLGIGPFALHRDVETHRLAVEVVMELADRLLAEERPEVQVAVDLREAVGASGGLGHAPQEVHVGVVGLHALRVEVDGPGEHRRAVVLLQPQQSAEVLEAETVGAVVEVEVDVVDRDLPPRHEPELGGVVHRHEQGLRRHPGVAAQVRMLFIRPPVAGCAGSCRASVHDPLRAGSSDQSVPEAHDSYPAETSRGDIPSLSLRRQFFLGFA